MPPGLMLVALGGVLGWCPSTVAPRTVREGRYHRAVPPGSSTEPNPAPDPAKARPARLRIPVRIRRIPSRVAYRLAPDRALVGWPPEIGRHRPASPPRTGIVGFYGQGNYGDELFLDVFREHLAGATDLTVLTQAREGPIPAASRAAVRAQDAIVIGGGDLVVPWQTNERDWSSDYLRRPVHIIGVGVPTWRESRPAAMRQLRRFLQHGSVRSITARDQESAAWIRDHLAPRVPVEMAADLVFALTLPPATRPGGQPILGIVVRWRNDQDDFSSVRAMAARGRQLGYRLRSIVLATGEVRRKDEAALARLALSVDEIVASDDLASLSRAIGECTMLASHKFHGTVVAAAYGVPAISMATTDKNRNLLRRLGRPEWVCAFHDPRLPELIVADPPSVDGAIVAEMRAEAIASLAALRARLSGADML
jgi:polysaccharide pyruvyl transferase WcaK-like protein